MLSSAAGYINGHFLEPTIFYYITENHIVGFIQETPRHLQWDSFKCYLLDVDILGGNTVSIQKRQKNPYIKSDSKRTW